MFCTQLYYDRTAILLLFLADGSKQNQTKKCQFYVYIL